MMDLDHFFTVHSYFQTGKFPIVKMMVLTVPVRLPNRFRSGFLIGKMRFSV
jgi:hypothetical protein